MKLRNKKTGEIVEVNALGLVFNRHNQPFDLGKYASIKELTENWEDAEEPLIKDEKIRKAVRAWAEANKFSSEMFFTYYANLYQLSCWQASIEFNSPIDDLKDGKEYYFAELCGEEEKCES